MGQDAGRGFASVQKFQLVIVESSKLLILLTFIITCVLNAFLWTMLSCFQISEGYTQNTSTTQVLMAIPLHTCTPAQLTTLFIELPKSDPVLQNLKFNFFLSELEPPTASVQVVNKLTLRCSDVLSVTLHQIYIE
jgi:hypothetical protein